MSIPAERLVGLAQASAAEKVYGLLESEETPAQAETGDPAARTPEQGEEAAPSDVGATEGAEPEHEGAPREGQESQPEGAGAAEREEPEGEAPQTVAELAEALEVDPGYLYGIQVPVSQPDGTATPMTLGELKDKAQEFARVDTERAAITTQRQAFESERQAALNSLQDQLTQARSVLERVTAAYLPANLRQDDPAEWTARARELDSLTAQIGGIHQQAIDDQRRQHEAQQRELVAQEQGKLMEQWDHWKDPTQRAADYQRKAEFLGDRYGFKPEEVAQAIDSRLWLMVADAQAYHEQQNEAQRAAKTLAKKRVAKLPRIMRSGTRETEQQRAADDRAQRMDALRQVGRTRDARAGMGLAASLVEDLIEDI